MQRDGIRTAFIHRSIQEFFAAFFVKHLGAENTVKKIYERIKGRNLLNWQQELRFLQQIDKYRYIEYYRLPAIKKFLAACEYNASKKACVSKSAFLRYLAVEPIIAIKRNNSAIKAGSRPYWVIVISGDEAHNEFTTEVGNMFQADGVIADSNLLSQARSPSTPNTWSLATHAKKHLTEANAAHTKFQELARKLDREQQKLEKVLSERKDNFRDLLFSSN